MSALVQGEMFAKPSPWSCLPVGKLLEAYPPGLACRLGRFAAERHRRSLTPSRAHTKEICVPSQAREGDFNFNI